MANKCNITKYAIDKLNSLHYGFSCKHNNAAILENYITYLGCPNINLVVCDNDPTCTDGNPVIFRCTFNIISISATLSPESGTDVIFDVKIVDYQNGVPPFTYEWEWDSDDFDLVEGTDSESAELRLKVKPGKVVDYLVSNIYVGVTDSNGCFDSKSCWLVMGNMQCGFNYDRCPNPVGLTANMIYTPCPAPTGLVANMFID